MKYIFILNRFSLKSNTSLIVEKIEKACKKRKLDYKIEINNSTMSTEDILKKYKKTKSIIMAVGGDGTINRVLNGIVGTKNILGYIPYGTGNDFYRANQEVLNKGINTIDLISINNKYFINIACFGIDAVIGNNSDIIHSRIIPKKYRYKMGLLVNFLKYKPKNFIVSFNNKSYKDEYTTIVVCNARYYGGGYRVSPNSSLDDGLLEVLLVKKTTKYDMAKLISSMKNAFHLKSSKIELFQTDELVIKTDSEISSNIDGEELTSDTFKIKLIPKGINVYYDQDLIDDIIVK